MPRRTSIHHAVTPHSPTNAVNDVFAALSRKLISQHVEHPKEPTPTIIRRASLKMDHILPLSKNHKKRDDSRDRDPKKSKSMRPPNRSSNPSSRHASRQTSPVLAATPPGKFSMIMESPPTILHGTATYSNGAIIAGRLKFDVTDPSGGTTLKDFTMVLQVKTTTKKPVSKDCPDCAVKVEVVKKWDFLSEPKAFYKMKDNQFPWSYMLEGRMPASSISLLGSISYAFVVSATTTLGEHITFSHPIEVKRAIVPGPDKASIRIFPPTHLTGKVVMPPVVHPIGKFPVVMSLSGIVEKKEQSQTRWRLKKMMWRIEEQSKIKSTPCARHHHKVSEGKAIQHADSKQLGYDEMKSGWKTDFDTAGGEITLEFEASLATKPSHKVCCDVDSQSGLDVKHNLVIELIVAEEFVPNKNTNLITPTGAARVLRMQFALIVSERAGMGISWEEEMPPMYDDVPPSPPGYGRTDSATSAFGGAMMEDYFGPSIEYHDLERVPTVSGPPVYRERDAADIEADQATRTFSNSGESSEMALNQVRQRLGGFRLDELEAEPPQFSSRGREDSTNGEPEIDYAEGEAGAAPQPTPNRR